MILSVSVAAFVVASYNGNLSPVVKFIQTAKDKYGYNSEQALGMLFWHKHDMDRAIRDLANFTPLPDEFSLQDNALFDQAFQVQLYHLDAPLWCENSMTLCFYLQIHGKSFQRIRQMLPEKSLAALIKHYYRWDGDGIMINIILLFFSRARTSVMVKQARKLTAVREEEAMYEGPPTTDNVFFSILQEAEHQAAAASQESARTTHTEHSRLL